MYKNTLTIKAKIKSALKRAVAWSILFTAALLTGRARVLFCSLLHTINYKKKGKATVDERLTKFFFD